MKTLLAPVLTAALATALPLGAYAFALDKASAAQISESEEHGKAASHGHLKQTRSPALSPSAPNQGLAKVSEKSGERVADAKAKIIEKASKLDVNKDGWLDERETARGKKILNILYAAIHDRVDRNQDGKVAVSEYVDSQVKEIERADRNNDGFISEVEARAHKRLLVKEILVSSGSSSSLPSSSKPSSLP